LTIALAAKLTAQRTSITIFWSICLYLAVIVGVGVDEYYLPGSVFVKTTPCDFNSWIAYIADEDGALGMQRGGEVIFTNTTWWS
jgi:hypothetical protein